MRPSDWYSSGYEYYSDTKKENKEEDDGVTRCIW